MAGGDWTGAVAGSSANRAMSSSYWGLPHLWQKRASSERSAPQVQRGGTLLFYEVCQHVAFFLPFKMNY